MILKEKMCYSRLLYMMTQGERFSNAVITMRILNGPCFANEGVLGYIETDVEFTINNLVVFTSIWEEYYKLSDDNRMRYRSLAYGNVCYA